MTVKLEHTDRAGTPDEVADLTRKAAADAVEAMGRTASLASSKAYAADIMLNASLHLLTSVAFNTAQQMGLSTSEMKQTLAEIIPAMLDDIEEQAK